MSYVYALPLEQLKHPTGFKIEIFAENIASARQMAVSAKGTVFVGTRDDKVYAITEENGKKKVLVLLKGLNVPNGVAIHQGDLYVAEIDKISKYANIEKDLSHPPKPVLIRKLPDKSWHGQRYITFGPDGLLYVGIGMPCNVCLQDNPQFGTIMRMKPDGYDYEIFASGIRNTVGFDFDPVTRHLWFTENGRDYLGDNSPPDKLNVAPKQGLNFGFPYYNGKNLPDPTYGNRKPQTDFTMPTLALPAHVAPLGMAFYTGDIFPNSDQEQIFAALHGSWNRSTKVGYKVIRVVVSDSKVLRHEDFITGWEKSGEVWGRPVDVVNYKNGLLISDDYANVLYKVTYGKHG